MIKKFFLADAGGYVKIEMPEGTKILSVGYDYMHEFPVLFAEVIQVSGKVVRTFYTQATGDVQEWKMFFGSSDMVYLGTALQPPGSSSNSELGLHIYEITAGLELPGPISGKE